MTPKTHRPSFTLIEIMVAIGIIALLAAVFVVVASHVVQGQKIARTRQTLTVLADAVNAFHEATKYYPLAVPEDGWDGDVLDTNFVNGVRWNPRCLDYFGLQGGKMFAWDSGAFPTNIQMLTFQLEQVPESNAIIQRLRNTVKPPVQRKPDPTHDTWVNAGGACSLYHPLDQQQREAYQPQDPWFTPLRYWSADTLTWAKGTGNWRPEVQSLLAGKLQQANWGFFLESAGPDGRFGWWGGGPAPTKDAEDNIYSVGQ